MITATSSNKYLVNPDYANFGPRVGLAYQLVPDRAVIRAGYGIFYSAEDFFGSDIALALNPPTLIPVTVNSPTFGLSDTIPSGTLSMSNAGTLDIHARDKDWHSARIQQYNLAFEFRLPLESTFELGYVGNRGRNLVANYEQDQSPWGSDPSNVPYPAYDSIWTGTTLGASHYNSLQMKFEKRFTKGWYMLDSYSYASAMDDSGAWGSDDNPQVLNHFYAEKGPQTNVARHTLSIADVYELPVGRGRKWGNQMNPILNAVIGGWQMSNIISARSGLPMNVRMDPTGTDPNTGKSIDFTLIPNNYGDLRPNRVGKPNTGINPNKDRLHFLNAAAYTLQTANTPGNAQRNSALAPMFRKFDISIVKRVNFSETKSLDVRAEMFNMFNNVNFKAPANTWGDDDFGVISDAWDPRVVQLAVRFRY